MMAYPAGQPRTTVLIPTTCEKRREPAIWRAVESVVQQGGDGQAVVVVNGSLFDRGLFDALRDRRDIQVANHDVGSLAVARRFGRSLVATKYFTFLDDDDEILPGTLKYRVEKLDADVATDVVVSNGYVYDGAHEVPIVQDFSAIAPDPLLSLMRCNWFATCGGLFRTATITEEFFDGITEYGEWTMLTVRLLLAGRKFAFVEVPTFRKHEETVESMSKTAVYADGQLATLQELLKFDLPPQVRTLVLRKVGAELHTRSDSSRAGGQLKDAWMYHLRSLRFPGGWRHLPYSRKLLSRGRGHSCECGPA